MTDVSFCYLDLKQIQEISNLQPIIQNIIDFVIEKAYSYMDKKVQGDAKLLFNCLQVINSIISNNFFTFENRVIPLIPA